MIEREGAIDRCWRARALERKPGGRDCRERDLHGHDGSEFWPGRLRSGTDRPILGFDPWSRGGWRQGGWQDCGTRVGQWLRLGHQQRGQDQSKSTHG